MSSSRAGGYSLFIGRIPKNIRVRELEDIFSRHGPLTRCDVKYSGMQGGPVSRVGGRVSLLLTGFCC